MKSYFAAIYFICGFFAIVIALALPAKAQVSQYERSHTSVDGGGAVDGLIFRLELDHPTMVSTANPDTDINARMDSTVYVKNVSDKRRTLTLKAIGGHQVRWELTGEDGQVFLPTFFPPPMPLPPDDPLMNVRLSLGPNEERVAFHWHGISGFYQKGNPNGLWYRVPPAGTYAVAVEGQILDSKFPKVVFAPVKLVVRNHR